MSKQRNGLLDNLKATWTPNAKVRIDCADPKDYKKNDEVCSCFEKSLPMSGLSISYIDKQVFVFLHKLLKFK